MVAQKVIVKIEMHSLSIDVLKGMLVRVIEQVEQEVEDGSLSLQDGDYIKWETTRTGVKF